jgi:D-alanyl-D-alanine carboxypeptidase/D-alanyl-D-alanine-endopeptidase (penicillin-binding protein 4)
VGILRTKKWLFAILCVAVFLITAGKHITFAEQGIIPEEITALVQNGGFAVQKSGRTCYSLNAERGYIPASIIKIATALLALDILGPDFQFTTRFYTTPEKDLYIQGSGDPFLISEEVALIVSHLLQKGIVEIRDIILDDSAFLLQSQAAGTGSSDNPYDAENSALSVNFNTVYFVKNGNGTVISAESQTPTVALMGELAQSMEPGTYRQNITGGGLKGEVVSRYVGELFQAIFQDKGVAITGGLRRGVTPDGLSLIYSHQSSTTMDEGLRRLMQYSNNFIANQLFLASGMKRYGHPATWEKGRQVFKEFMTNRAGLGEGEIHIVEGSGISRGNRISPTAMLRVLNLFKPHGRLLSEKTIGQRQVFLKSGTLTGVSSYAGYFVDNERLDSFVLIINQGENNRDRLLGLLTKLYNATPADSQEN